MNRDEIFARLTEVFRDIFDDETLELEETTSPDDIPEWDSLANISLIAATEREFGIRFDMKTIKTLKTAGDIADQIGNNLP